MSSEDPPPLPSAWNWRARLRESETFGTGVVFVIQTIQLAGWLAILYYGWKLGGCFGLFLACFIGGMALDLLTTGIVFAVMLLFVGDAPKER